MGLIKIKSVKDYKRIKEFLTAMEYYGIDETDLENVKLIPSILENQKKILAYLDLIEKNKTRAEQENIALMLDEKIEVLKTNE